MKRIMATFAGIVLTAALVMATAYQLGSGYGKQVAVSTTTTVLTISEAGVTEPYATSVSVYNAGTSTVFCAINSTASTFAIMMAASNAVPIPQAMIYTFGSSHITSLCLATTNGNATAYVGAH